MKKWELASSLKDYHWMINSIKVMQESLNESESKMTASYGIEATLPSGQGTTGDPIFRETLRREKRWEVVSHYESKVKEIQDRIHLITDERELEVLHWMLEGKGYSWISRHMGLSERHIRRLKDSIVEKMCEENAENAENAEYDENVNRNN